MRMSYKQYKQHYSDCKDHDYNASDKTIEVDIPYGRMKNSGVRGKKYGTFTFKATDGENVGTIEYKAIAGGIPYQEWLKIVDKFGNEFDLWK